MTLFFCFHTNLYYLLTYLLSYLLTFLLTYILIILQFSIGLHTRITWKAFKIPNAWTLPQVSSIRHSGDGAQVLEFLKLSR